MAIEPVQFGRYRLLNLLGEGGMAKVYRALLAGPMGFEKEVAVKRLDPRLTADERVIRALINEARLGGQLRHKNIVEIYEFNEVNGNWYMAMEYVKGWTLESVLRDCRVRREHLPGTVIVDLVAHVCRGLDYAHSLLSKDGASMNLVHRDMKPGNVILNEEGDVKVMDFGIAKADTNLYKTTEADVTKGTPVYMSPEQVTGEPLDRRSDLFSVGSMLCEMVTLDVPFQGANLLALMHAVLHAELDGPAERMDARLPQLTPIFRRCCAQQREDRFATARELGKAIRAVRNQLPPGPDLDEWIHDLSRQMPSATRTGEFGPDGAPAPQVPAGTESLNSVRTATSDVPPIGGALFDEFDEPDPRAAWADAAGAPAEPDSSPFHSPPGSPPPGVTRVQRSIPSAPVVPKPSRPRRRKAKARRRGMLWVGLALLVCSLAVVAGTLFLRSQTPRPTTGRADSTPAPGPAAVPTSTPAVAPRATTATAAIQEVAEARPTPRPARSPTPPVSAPTPRRTPATTPVPALSSSEPGPTPTPTGTAEAPAPADPPPAPAVLDASPPELGWVDFNSKPWSNVIVDSTPIKNTPVMQHPLPAGVHTVIFDCTSCDPPQREERTFTVEAGVRSKQIVRFGGR